MLTLQIDGLEDLVERIVSVKLALAEPDPWLDAKAAAEHLHVSVQRVHDLVSQGRLPRHGAKGHRLRFRRSELDAYLESRGR